MEREPADAGSGVSERGIAGAVVAAARVGAGQAWRDVGEPARLRGAGDGESDRGAAEAEQVAARHSSISAPSCSVKGTRGPGSATTTGAGATSSPGGGSET